ncbi:MAG: hypothetical protein ACI4U2_01700 [Christensenellaceae bacterium]
MERFIIGLAVGMVGGAVIVANSYKARQVVKKSQDELCDKFDRMLDEKLSSMGGKSSEESRPFGCGCSERSSEE